MTEYNFEQFKRETPAMRKQALRKKLLGLPPDQLHEVGVLIRSGMTFEGAMKQVTKP